MSINRHSPSSFGRNLPRGARVSMLAIALASPSAAGCAAHYPVASPPASLDQCDVAMQLTYGGDYALPNGEVIEGQDTPFVPGGATYIISKPVCVKHAGQQPRIPDNIELRMDDARYDHYGLCEQGSVSNKLASYEDGSKGKSCILQCRWNRQFRDAYPLNVTLYTLDHSKLSRHIEVVRIFRNGSLAYKWLASDDYDDSPLSGGEVLFISGKELRRQLMPHLAPFDIRLIGAGVEVDEAARRQEVAKQQNKVEERIRTALNAALNSKVFANGTLNEQLKELDTKARDLVCRSEALVARQEKKCGEVTYKPGELVGFYDQLRDTALSDLKEIQAEAEAKIVRKLDEMKLEGEKELDSFKTQAKDFWNAKDHPNWLEIFETAQRKGKHTKLAAAPKLKQFKELIEGDSELKPLLQESINGIDDDNIVFLPWFKLRAGGEELKDILDKGDALMRDALSAVDETRKLVNGIHDDLQALTKDGKRQSQLFNDVFQSLDTNIFDQYADNPPPAKGETVLSLVYSDVFQWYFLAPWHGLVLREDHGPNGDELNTQFNATSLVPIIDIVGNRFQFGGNRFTDLRFAFGVANLIEEFQDTKTVNEGGVQVTKDVSRQIYTFVPQLNVGLANIRFGVGYALPTQGAVQTFPQGFRFILGADLAKLISGHNIEAATR